MRTFPASLRVLFATFLLPFVLVACGGNGGGSAVVTRTPMPTSRPAAVTRPTLRPTSAPTRSALVPSPPSSPIPLRPTPESLPEPAPLVPTFAYAWQEAPPGRDSAGNPVLYSADQTIDGHMDTAWRVPGDGKNATVTLSFNRAVRLSEVRIVPGYAKIDPTSGEDRFTQNRRVRRVRLVFTGGHPVDADLAERPELQSIKFEPVVTSHVEVMVLQTTAPGARDGRDFTPISEIVPIGQICNPGQCGELGDEINALLGEKDRSSVGGSNIKALADGYARLYLLPADRALDPLTIYYKQEGRTWVSLSAGSFFSPEDLQEMGIPESVWPD